MNRQDTFTVHHLRFEVEATTRLALDPPPGPKLRAALYQALGMVCPMGGDANAPAEHKAACPVCWLLATEKPGEKGGKDLPRPVTVEPPLDLPQGWIEAGGRFSFGLSLFAQAANLFPYLALGVPEMGRQGLGRRLPELDGQRGRFTLHRAEAVNPLTGERQALLDAARGPLFQVPAVPVTSEHVRSATERIVDAMREGESTEGRLEMRFLTLTRIVTAGRLAHEPDFAPLFARLYDRLGALSTHYADGALATRRSKERLMALADQVRLVAGQGGWREAHSYSRRLRGSTPVSGYVGAVVYEAAVDVWAPLLPYLLWGQSTHVGKSATKGNGWYEVGGELWPSSNI